MLLNFTFFRLEEWFLKLFSPLLLKQELREIKELNAITFKI
jgi:hypothetical protein